MPTNITFCFGLYFIYCHIVIFLMYFIVIEYAFDICIKIQLQKQIQFKNYLFVLLSQWMFNIFKAVYKDPFCIFSWKFWKKNLQNGSTVKCLLYFKLSNAFAHIVAIYWFAMSYLYRAEGEILTQTVHTFINHDENVTQSNEDKSWIWFLDVK